MSGINEAISDILTLFANSFYGSIVVGVVCPLMGVFFLVRRVVFLGIAVPQFAAAGVAFGFMVCPWFHERANGYSHGPGTGEAGFAFHLFWATAFTFGALLVLALLGERNGSAQEGRIAAGYSFAAAATILFLSAGAFGAGHVQVLLRGEILALSGSDLLAIIILFGVVLVAFILFHRNFLLVGYDREAAMSLGKNPLLWDVILYCLMGASISVGVITVGPLVIFGLLVIPPLAARAVAFNMTSFYVTASAIGLVTAVLGFMVSYMLDWPLGPTDVVLAFALMCLVRAGKAVYSMSAFSTRKPISP